MVDQDDRDQDKDFEQEPGEEGELNPAQNTRNKILKLSLKYEKGQSSYIYWPCTIALTDERLHVTAKFFGDVPILVDEIREVIERVPGFDEPIDISEIEWTPVVFATKNDGAVAVLELTKCPPVFRLVHDALAKFRRDDYDSYRPHITVPDDVWTKIHDEKITPQQAKLEFFPLELSIKGLVKYKWGDNPGPVEEIDGEDVHTNNPTEESFAARVHKMVSRLSSR